MNADERDGKGEDDSYEAYGCGVNRYPPFSGRVGWMGYSGRDETRGELGDTVPCVRLEDVGYSGCRVIDILVGLSRGQHETHKATRQGK